MTIVWLALIVLVNGDVLAETFKDEQDCKTNVAYASVNQDVVTIHYWPNGQACLRMILKGGRK
jgi:hypothetical protein